MKIKELITLLEEIENKEGNIDVKVQHHNHNDEVKDAKQVTTFSSSAGKFVYIR